MILANGKSFPILHILIILIVLAVFRNTHNNNLKLYKSFRRARFLLIAQYLPLDFIIFNLN
jgi:hypothetical protein